MFGTLITSASQVSIGTYGYIVSFDLSINEMAKIVQVQMQNASTLVLSTVSASGASLAALNNYPQLSSCPTFAWAQDGQTLYVFCKTATYPYTSATRVGIWYYRNAADLTAVTDNIDVSQDKEQLFRYLVLDTMYTNMGQRTPQVILQGISVERKRLGI
jgi:hypothetical protein